MRQWGQHQSQKAAGAKPEVKAKARDILYELSATLEGIKSKKRKRDGEDGAADEAEATKSTDLPVIENAEVIAAAEEPSKRSNESQEGIKKAKKKKKKAKLDASNHDPAAQGTKEVQVLQIFSPRIF